jgi:hypothetical protein
MDGFAANLLPPEYKQASDVLQKMFSARPLATGGAQQFLASPEVQVSKGYNFMNWKEGASQDIVQISLKSPTLVTADGAEAVSKMVLSSLNDIEAVRNEVMLVSPKEYHNQVKAQMGALLQQAKAVGVPGSEIDYTQSSILDPHYSGNQIPSYGTGISDGPRSTDIRVNIPTNPDRREDAAVMAKKVADNLTQRLPEIKAAMLKRIIEKGYIPNLDDAKIKQLMEHKFEVVTAQQSNWTSVFIGIRSPEQEQHKANPGVPVDMEKLKATNLLMQIPDEKNRFKLAARSVLFEGPKLQTPSAIFMDVAGTQDMENAVGKVMFRLKKAKPELAVPVDALMKENVFKRADQWNLPPDKREEYKRAVKASIDPDHPDVIKFSLPVPRGKAAEIVAAIAGLERGASTLPTRDANLDALANAIVANGQSLEGWADMMSRQKDARSSQKSASLPMP